MAVFQVLAALGIAVASFCPDNYRDKRYSGKPGPTPEAWGNAQKQWVRNLYVEDFTENL